MNRRPILDKCPRRRRRLDCGDRVHTRDRDHNHRFRSIGKTVAAIGVLPTDGDNEAIDVLRFRRSDEDRVAAVGVHVLRRRDKEPGDEAGIRTGMMLFSADAI